MSQMIKTYSELITFDNFIDRYNYLKLNGVTCKDTFGVERYLNQLFYKSEEWKQVRNFVISRDNGCDLGLKGYEIFDQVLIHHINPITIKDIDESSDILLDPNNLITTKKSTHNAIHYCDERFLLRSGFAERSKDDTCLWKGVY